METLLTGLSTFGLGFGTVFVGLICLILIIKLMTQIFLKTGSKKVAAVSAQPAAQASVEPTAPEIENRGQFIAAVSAAIATSIGSEVSGLRILSVKKVNQ